MNTSSTGPERFSSFAPQTAQDVISYIKENDERTPGFLGGLAHHMSREISQNPALLNGAMPSILKIFDGLGREPTVAQLLENVLVAVNNGQATLSSQDLDGIHDVSMMARFSEVGTVLKEKHIVAACKANAHETSPFFASDMQKIYGKRPDLIEGTVGIVLKKLEGQGTKPLVGALLQTISRQVSSGAASIKEGSLSGLKDLGVKNVLGHLTPVGPTHPIVLPVHRPSSSASLSLT